MASIALERGDVIVAVDTHKDQHVALALDGLGGRVGDPIEIAATVRSGDQDHFETSWGERFNVATTSTRSSDFVFVSHCLFHRPRSR